MWVIFMKKYEVVKEHKDFDEIIENGKYRKSKNFVIYNKDSNFNFPRFGIAVGKKVGNAVIRNKLKRQFRMLLTTNKNLFSNNKDYIIIVKRSALMSSYQELDIELKKLMENR